MNKLKLEEVFFISHNDADGFASMTNLFDAIVGFNFLYEDENINIEKKKGVQFLDDPNLFLNLNYPLDFPYEKVPSNRIVFISDYSFTQDTIHILHNIAMISKLVIWTDHHKSSMWYKDYHMKDESIDTKIIPILFDGSSSTMTTYYMNKFFNLSILKDNLNNYIEKDYLEKIREIFINFMNYTNESSPKEAFNKAIKTYKEFCKNNYNHYSEKEYIDDDPPMYIKLIDDYDIWKHEYIDTLPFHYGLNMYNHSVYTDLIIEDKQNLEGTYLDILDFGDAIKKYINIQNEEISTKYSFVRKFFYDDEHGMVDILCINGRGNSFVFGDKFEHYPFCLLYHFDGDVWKYSIYSHKKYLDQGYDASIIAKDYGGGGHAGASGFSTIKLLDILI